MQRDSRRQIIASFLQPVFYVHACVHRSVCSGLCIHQGIAGFLPPFC